MKALLTEYEFCFGIELAAETMEEAALMVRFGINTKQELRTKSAYVHPEGKFALSVVIPKIKKPTVIVPTKR